MSHTSIAITIGGTASAAGTASPVDPAVDISNATPEAVALVTAVLRDKTARNPERFMANFSRTQLTCGDGTLGVKYSSWSEVEAAMAQAMPAWPPTSRAYPTKILGDARSAMVFYVDSPEMFGNEIRIIAPIDFRDGKVVRQVDYWDGRHFGTATTHAIRVPPDRFATDFGEAAVGEQREDGGQEGSVEDLPDLHPSRSRRLPIGIEPIDLPQVDDEISLVGGSALAGRGLARRGVWHVGEVGIPQRFLGEHGVVRHRLRRPHEHRGSRTGCGTKAGSEGECIDEHDRRCRATTRLQQHAAERECHGDRETRHAEQGVCLRGQERLPALLLLDLLFRDSMERLDQAFQAARTFKPLAKEQLDALVARTKQVAMTGKFEPFKTTAQFDGTAKHPEWMG